MWLPGEKEAERERGNGERGRGSEKGGEEKEVGRKREEGRRRGREEERKGGDTHCESVSLRTLSCCLFHPLSFMLSLFHAVSISCCLFHAVSFILSLFPLTQPLHLRLEMA